MLAEVYTVQKSLNKPMYAQICVFYCILISTFWRHTVIAQRGRAVKQALESKSMGQTTGFIGGDTIRNTKNLQHYDIND